MPTPVQPTKSKYNLMLEFIEKHGYKAVDHALEYEGEDISKELDEILSETDDGSMEDIKAITKDLDFALDIISRVYSSGVKLDELEDVVHHILVDYKFSKVGNSTDAKSQSLADIQADAIDSLVFPDMLRTMWSGVSVQEWLKDQAIEVRESGIKEVKESQTL